MNAKGWYVYVATLGPIGYLPASGTITTLIALPLMYWLRTTLQNDWLYLGVVILIGVFGMFVISSTLDHVKRHEDPPEIVFDELVGCLLVFNHINLSPQSMIVGFLLFRALDSIKFHWLRPKEQVIREWAVMGDDVVAAVITNFVLAVIYGELWGGGFGFFR